MELLNDLYQHFDDCVDAYNVWKVETIGDAYLVASGVPDQHENHATEICKMSLDLLSKVMMSGVVCVSVKILGLLRCSAKLPFPGFANFVSAVSDY